MGTSAVPVPVAVQFARAVRLLTREVRRLGLTVPAFRSPPRLPGVDRTIRWTPWGAVVAVRISGRPLEVVLTDLVDGVVAANGLEARPARRARVVLLRALVSELGRAAEDAA